MTFSSLSCDSIFLLSSLDKLQEIRSRLVDHKKDSSDIRAIHIYLRAIENEGFRFSSAEDLDALRLNKRVVTLEDVDTPLVDAIVSVYKKNFIFSILPEMLPEEEKKEIISLLWNLVKLEHNKEGIRLLALSIAGLPYDDRRSVGFILDRYFIDLSDFDAVMLLFDRVKVIPLIERDKICDLAIQTMCGRASVQERISMIDFLEKVPSDKRNEICYTVLSLIDPVDNTYLFSRLAYIYMRAPEGSWILLTNQLSVFYKSDLAESFKERLADLFCRVKPSEILGFVKISQRMFCWAIEEDEIIQVLHTLLCIPGSNRMAAIEFASAMTRGIREESIGIVLSNCIKIDPADFHIFTMVSALLNQVLKLELEGYDPSVDLAECINHLCCIDRENTSELFEVALGMYSGIDNVSHFSGVLKCCSAFATEEREAVFQILKDLIRSISSGFDKKCVLDNVLLIQESQREKFCRMLGIYCPDGISDVDKIRFIDVFKSLFLKCNDEGIALTMEVALKGDSAQQCIDMMKLFDSIVDVEVVPVAKILLQLDLHIKSFEFKSKMFGLIAKIQGADRDHWLRSGLSIMRKVQDKEDAFLIFRALRYMPNSLMGRFAEFTSQYIDACEPFTDHLSLIHKFLSNNTDCIDTVHNNMMYSLHHIGDANEANDLSSELINCNQNFMLDSEHPLYQLAIFVCLITLEANHPKNPYKVFDSHINAIYLNKQELIVPVLKFLDKYVQIKFSTFGDMVRDQITYDTMMSFYNQTPLTSADLHSLLQRVNSRIDKLSLEINSQIKDLVKESCGFSLDDLLRNFNDPYLFQLLELTEGLNIAKEKAFFGAILSFILKQSDEVQEGQLVSNQEMALFKMSSSIQNCPAGKNEGILLAYNQLELADKIPTAQQDELSPIASKVKMRCYSLLVEKMDQMISSDTPMMREMTDETGEVAQLSHQSLYVKNRLSSVIGLDHGIRFDLHTNVLYNELIQKSTEQLFHIFASHCTVGFFAEQLIQDFDLNFKKEPLFIGYGDLVAGSISADTMWDIESDGIGFALSKQGAMAILEALEVIRIIDPRMIAISVFNRLSSGSRNSNFDEEDILALPSFFQRLIEQNIPYLANHMLPHFPRDAIKEMDISVMYDPVATYQFRISVLNLALLDMLIDVLENDGEDLYRDLFSLLNESGKRFISSHVAKERFLASSKQKTKASSLSNVLFLKKLKNQFISSITSSYFV